MRKTKTHNVLRRLLAFVLIVSLLPLGYAGNVWLQQPVHGT